MIRVVATVFCLLLSAESSLGFALALLLAEKCAAAETIMSPRRSPTFAHEFAAADLLGLNKQELAAAVSRWNQQPGELRTREGTIHMNSEGTYLSYNRDSFWGYAFQLQYDDTGKVCALRRGIHGCTGTRYTRWMRTSKAVRNDDRKLSKFGDPTETKLARHFPYREAPDESK